MIREILFTGLAIAAADFITGLVHWWEDAYGNPNWKIFGKTVIQPNLRHHKQPREFIRGPRDLQVMVARLLQLCLIGLQASASTIREGYT